MVFVAGFGLANPESDPSFPNYDFRVRGLVQQGATNMPEPGSLALLGAGLAGFIAHRRRRA